MESKTFKAGKYYIGDLCYVVSDDNWIPLLESSEYLEGDNITFKNESIWAHSTHYGDGEYFDQSGRAYGVDAGIIGIMSADLRDKTNDYDNIIDFENDFEVSYEDGIFYFGNITIDTRNEDDRCGYCGNYIIECGCDDEEEFEEDWSYEELD